MHRRTQVAVALALLAIPLLGMPAILPVDPVLVHNTGDTTKANNTSALQQYHYGVYDASNLSERGREIYRNALQTEDAYRVPVGQGAPEFQYPTREAVSNLSQTNITAALRMSSVALVRSPDDGLPPADEAEGAREFETLSTYTAEPEMGSGAYVHHILGLALGMVALVSAAYLVVAKPEHRLFEK